ncbi:hypothetical protein [Pseudokineococcus lusitanus]|nr:hypothetical protein [Pseudokineococcus lusitanus]
MQIDLMDSSVLINVIGIRMEAQDVDAVRQGLAERIRGSVRVQIPVAAVIETAQHVQRIPAGNGDHRRACAEKLSGVIKDALRGEAPWAFRGLHWDEALLRDFLDQAPPVPNYVDAMSTRAHEAGDLLILSELRRLRASYPQDVVQIGVWTLDDGLQNIVDQLPGAARRR